MRHALLCGNLFGLVFQLQFYKLYVHGIFSAQRNNYSKLKTGGVTVDPDHLSFVRWVICSPWSHNLVDQMTPKSLPQMVINHTH